MRCIHAQDFDKKGILRFQFRQNLLFLRQAITFSCNNIHIYDASVRLFFSGKFESSLTNSLPSKKRYAQASPLALTASYLSLDWDGGTICKQQQACHTLLRCCRGRSSLSIFT